jgi:hypothetical protein
LSFRSGWLKPKSLRNPATQQRGGVTLCICQAARANNSGWQRPQPPTSGSQVQALAGGMDTGSISMAMQYRNDEPMAAGALEWLMGLIQERQAAVDDLLGYQVAETLLFALGRIKPTPDAEIPAENVIHQRFTGD